MYCKNFTRAKKRIVRQDVREVSQSVHCHSLMLFFHQTLFNHHPKNNNKSFSIRHMIIVGESNCGRGNISELHGQTLVKVRDGIETKYIHHPKSCRNTLSQSHGPL